MALTPVMYLIIYKSISYSINKKNSVKLWGGYSLMILAQQELTATVHPDGQQKEI